MKNPEAILNFIQAEKIQTVIEDLRLVEAGYTLYYAVDPHEVFNFCFPLRSTDAEHSEVDDMDEFAADQAALYDICFKRKEKPLLIGDYVDELDGLMRYSTDILSNAYDEAGVVDALIDKGGVEDISDQPRPIEDMADTVQAISEKFHIVLAVAMGIYSLGATRFRQIYRELVLDRQGLPHDNPTLSKHFEKYRETGLSLEILNELMKKASWADEKEFRRKRRSAFFDARAIDQLVLVNKSLLQQTNEKKAVILYLSSAQRTDTAFEMRSTKKELPLLNGKPFDFHRDRRHIYYEVAYRSDAGGVAGTIENLETVKRSVEELKKSTNTMAMPADLCSNCVLKNGQPDQCESLAACNHLKKLLEPLEQRNTEIRNLALTQTLGRYKELKSAKPEGASQTKLMEFFCRVFEDKQLKRVASQKKLHKEQLVFLQLGTPKNRVRTREATLRHHHLRTGRDSITGTVQYLPLNPKIKSPRYKEIVSLILNYFKTPPQGDEAKIALMNKAYGLYLDQESITTDLEAEHELTRCLLYLTLADIEGDQKAFHHAMEMLGEPTVLAEVSDSEAEFHYIACWSARRLKDFAAANEQATAGIEKWPADPRFYHGRSLSNLAAWENEKSDSKPIQLLLDAEQDALKSLEHYEAGKDEHREFIGVTYNNIAYINTLMAKVAGDTEAAKMRLRIARDAMTNLKQYIPESEWSPVHPNYFHTDALLDYFQSISGVEDKEEGQKLLMHAKEQINHAIACIKKDHYLELSKTIENALSFTGARI